MRPELVVVPSPTLDKHICLLERVEDLSIQQLVSELSVEALVVAVLPRAPRLDEERFHIDPAEPLTDRLGGELRAVVGADVIRWAAVCEQVREKVQHIVCADPTGDQDGETFPGVLVDDRQHPEGPAIMCPGQDEGVGSDVVRPARSETDAGPVVEPQPPPLRLLLGNFQPLAPPDAFDPLVVDDPTLGPESIAVMRR